MKEPTPLKVKFALLISALGVCPALTAAQQSANVRSPTVGAGLDCAKARSKIEKILCANPQLAALDHQTGELLALAMSQSADAGELKKAQRRWLTERDDCEDLACIENRYALRLDALATLTGQFPGAFARSLCARLETPETRAEALERTSGIDDINNDGKPEVSTTCTGGAASAPCVAYVDARNKPVLIQPQGFQWTLHGALGRAPFRYENRTFVYYSRDAQLAEPSHLSYITPTNREVRICEFETLVGSAVVEGGHDVCAAVESGEGVEEVELTDITEQQPAAFGRPDTAPKRLGKVDIDNDGLEEPLIELSYASGGGQDCTFNYFELLAEDGRSLLGSSNSAPVRELQDLRDDRHRERNCGRIENRLFEFQEKIYYETNVSTDGPAAHEVRVLEGTAVETLCTLERQVTTKVKTVW